MRHEPAPLTVATAAPVIIDPNAIYDLDAATRLVALPLGLGETTLLREIRQGRLTAARRGGRYLMTGRALLAWAEGRTLGKRASPVG
jgi:hypothetical protein